MSCHMMRVISSPSSSTTGFLTLIFRLLPEVLPDCSRLSSAFNLLVADMANVGLHREVRRAEEARQSVLERNEFMGNVRR
jgi:hypothetical protein